MKKIIFGLISLTLVFLFVFQMPTQVVAVSVTRYVCDLLVATDEDAGKAKKKLTDAGYQVVDADLNGGTGEGFVYLGFKTSPDKADAITDISMMDMDGGYKRLNCRASAQASAGNISGMVHEMMVMAQELGANLEKGSLTAQLARRGLDLFYVPEAGNASLSDYLISPDRQSSDFYNILLMSNSTVLSAIYTYLAVGTENPDGSSWLKSVSGTGPITVDYDDAVYLERADKLMPSFNDFAEKCNAALARMEANGGKVPEPAAKTEQESEKIALEVQSEALDEVNTDNTDFIYISAYNNLKKYTYGNKTLADFFTTPVTDSAALYPLVKSLTEGQYAAIHSSGILPLLINSFHDQASFDNAMAKMNATTERLSLWVGVNTEAYEGEVGVTDSAYRLMSATKYYNAITNPDTGFSDTLSLVFQWVGVISSCAEVFFLAMGAISFISIAFPVFFSQCFVTAIIAGLAQGIAASSASGVFGIISMVLMVILGIVYLGHKIIELYDYYHPDYTPIPTQMYDLKNNSDFIQYHVVNDHNGNAADLNLWEGLGWNALYYSKDPNAGSPLIANDLGEAFKVVTGNGTTPDGYRPVTFFDENNAVDLNRNTYSPDYSIYLFCISESPAVPKSTGKKGKYINSVYLQAESTSEAAIYELRNKGYEVLNVNLTEGLDKATYLGYTTNDAVSLALTDIRIQYGTNADRFSFGEASYGACGSSGPYVNPKKSSIESGEYTLYATKSPLAGDPILADENGLLASRTFLSETTGYEPVSLFCSGTAFDFNTQSQEKTPSWDTNVYLYFKPSVVYTSGTKYISGVFFTDLVHMDNAGSGADYNTLLGGTGTGYYSSTGQGYSLDNEESVQWETYNVFMYTTTTFNPKRALHDIGYYTSPVEKLTLPDNLICVGNGYAACEVLCQVKGFYTTEPYRTARKTNAFKTGNDTDFGYDSSSEWMYVMGASSTLPPLKESDVSFDSSAAVPAGCQNLRNISSYYEHPSHDFAPGQMFTSEEKHFYMFIRDDGLSAPKYISSIKTNYTALDDMANDYSKSTLLLSGCDKVIDRDLNAEDTDDKGGYLGITRTNDLSKATLRGIAVYYVKNGETACPETVKDSNGSTFTKLSSDGIYVGHNYYAYLYTSTAKTLGDPITDITIDDTPYVEGMETAPLLGTHANAFWYIHYKKAATTQMYLSSLDVRGYNSDATIYKSGGWNIFWRAEANKDENVKDELLLGGFRNLLDYEASYRKETGTKYSRYLGYNTTANKNRAITGIIATRGEEWKNQITYNGIIYYPIASRTDLNGNSDYEKICLYWTTDKQAGSPISEINVSVSQYAQSGWNMVCNQNGAAVNINSQNDSDSCGATNNDNACYFTFRRADNSVDRTNSFVASVFSQPAAASIIILGMIILLSGGIVLVVKRVRRAKEAR